MDPSPLLPDQAVTPAALLERVAAARERADAAEVEILEVAAEWARGHLEPDQPDWRPRGLHTTARGETVDGAPDPRWTEDEDLEWFGIPRIRWDAAAPFAAANGMSTRAGRALIRDVLVLDHRLPLTWARTRAGQVPGWRARRIAQAVLGAPVDVVAHIDAAVAEIAHKVGPVVLDRLLEEAMLRLHPEQREEELLGELHARRATLDARDVQRTGLADLHIRGDYKDLFDFDQTLSDLAAALAAGGDSDSLEERRARAVGVLADPERAAALLRGGGGAPATPPRKRAVLHLHLTAEALHGIQPVGRCDNGGLRPVLEQQVREWCARADTHLVVKPVIDLNQALPPAQCYEFPDRLAERVRLLQPVCVFPHCQRPARLADLDHIRAHATGGPTSEHNAAPLCRHHHRLKTLARWRYQRLGTHAYLWRDPHGRLYHRDGDGTCPVTVWRPNEADPDPPSASAA